jgi:hypothetical protein
MSLPQTRGSLAKGGVGLSAQTLASEVGEVAALHFCPLSREDGEVDCV